MGQPIDTGHIHYESEADFLAAYQPPEFSPASHGLLLKRFDLAASILAESPSPVLVELAICLTCPRGSA